MDKMAGGGGDAAMFRVLYCDLDGCLRESGRRGCWTAYDAFIVDGACLDLLKANKIAVYTLQDEDDIAQDVLLIDECAPTGLTPAMKGGGFRHFANAQVRASESGGSRRGILGR